MGYVTCPRTEAGMNRDYRTCRACGKKDSAEDRYSLGIYAGHLCGPCWKTR